MVLLNVLYTAIQLVMKRVTHKDLMHTHSNVHFGRRLSKHNHYWILCFFRVSYLSSVFLLVVITSENDQFIMSAFFQIFLITELVSNLKIGQRQEPQRRSSAMPEDVCACALLGKDAECKHSSPFHAEH